MWSEVRAVRSVDEINLNVDHVCSVTCERLVDQHMAKSEQPLGNFTTNLCEGWMHIRSKFDGGKHRVAPGKTEVQELDYDRI